MIKCCNNLFAPFFSATIALERLICICTLIHVQDKTEMNMWFDIFAGENVVDFTNQLAWIFRLWDTPHSPQIKSTFPVYFSRNNPWYSEYFSKLTVKILGLVFTRETSDSEEMLAKVFNSVSHMPPPVTGARCSSVVRAFAHGAMGRRIDPSWGGSIELFLVPASAPRLV